MSSGRMWKPSPINAGVGIPKGTSAVDHATNTILSYVFGKQTDDVFKNLKALGISHYYLCPLGTPMIGALIHAIWMLTNMRLANVTPRKLSVKT